MALNAIKIGNGGRLRCTSVIEMVGAAVSVSGRAYPDNGTHTMAVGGERAGFNSIVSAGG